ncbi:uncharacterized protein LOC127244052 isoform X2 [Andrographis paniculata]|uniref:uncharacterized protein LOC127244052 isoform X2 n=1 Tax=Andrographis paniculata TaxID=175694 RepID=UPI0021E9218F|nr:uncharacterized protein LOC127244052 isoform X2 [Andrographis paniculata]
MHAPPIEKTPEIAQKVSSLAAIWVPAVPSWEKEFCYEIGRFNWANFVQAKKQTELAPKIFDWNDSAAEEAFRRAKAAYFARIHGQPVDFPQLGFIPSPDMYIDEINWDNNGDGEDYSDLNADELTEFDKIADPKQEIFLDWRCIPIEDIKPTGWVVNVEKNSRGRDLTGMIVGG